MPRSYEALVRLPELILRDLPPETSAQVNALVESYYDAWAEAGMWRDAIQSLVAEALILALQHEIWREFGPDSLWRRPDLRSALQAIEFERMSGRKSSSRTPAALRGQRRGRS